MFDGILEKMVGISKFWAGAKVLILCLLVGGNVVQHYQKESLNSLYLSTKSDLERCTKAYDRLDKSSKMATKYVNEQCEGLLEYWERLLNANSKPDEDYLPKE
jgi:hypothetical protein